MTTPPVSVAALSSGDAGRSWTAGYVTELDYTRGYYRELNPVLLRYVLLHRGFALPSAPERTQPLRYLELGFGQGLSFAIHATASPGVYLGTDFNPGHAAGARALIQAAGVAADARDQSFAELAADPGLPAFDVITLHGVWSWISAENRAILVDLIRRKLAVGGVFYISYNCTPGWSPVMPLRHLIKTHADLAGSAEQAMPARIDAALAFAQRVAESGARYFHDNPNVTTRLGQMREQPRDYLAHEYFNRDWLPMPFSEVAEQLAAAKLDFVAPGDLVEQVDQVQFTAEMQALLGGLTSTLMRETVRDFMTGQQFRKDIFGRGLRPLSAVEQAERLIEEHVVLTVPADDVPMTLNVSSRQITLQESIYRPVLGMLSEHGYTPKRIGALLTDPAWEGKPLQTLIQALMILTGGGYIAPVQSLAAADAQAAAAACAALNRQLCSQARHREGVGFLASPLTGGGVPVSRFHMLFLGARGDGAATPAAWAQAAWLVLLQHNQRLMRDNQPIDSAEDNVAELTRQAETFERKALPVLQALGIA
jgi:SAM-dependent methyltransferase